MAVNNDASNMQIIPVYQLSVLLLENENLIQVSRPGGFGGEQTWLIRSLPIKAQLKQ